MPESSTFYMSLFWGSLRVQVHHIDENPANSEPDNLAVLCLHCHEQTQVKGGFGRKLDAAQVRLYQERWLARVEGQRNKVDEILSNRINKTQIESFSAGRVEEVGPTPPVPLKKYIALLPELLSDAYKEAETVWGRKTTVDMLNYSYTIAYSLENMLTYLSSFYPANHFDGLPPKDFISNIVSSRYGWHRNHTEPGGHGTRGTMIGPIIAQSVVHDLRCHVEDMVCSLTDWEDATEFLCWKQKWRAVGNAKVGNDFVESKGETIYYDAPSYWRKTDDKLDGPFCQRCYDADGKLIRLQEQSNSDRWFCSVCKSYFNGPRYVHPAPIVIPRSSGWT